MILDSTTKSVEVLLGDSVATNQLPFVAAWADHALPASFTPGSTDGLTNDETPVTMIAAPGTSIQRQVKMVSIYNADTTAAVVMVRLNHDGEFRTVVRWEIQPGETLAYDGQVWSVSPPAVCGAPHTLLSTTHIDTLADDVVAGDIIVGNGTPAWARLAKGPTDYVLKVGATLVDWGQVVTASIADGAVTIAKLASAVLDRMFTSLAKRNAVEALESGGNVATGKVVTASIAAGAVTDAKIADRAARSVMGRYASTDGPVADIQAPQTDGKVLRSFGDVGTTVGWGDATVRRSMVLVVPGNPGVSAIQSVRLVAPVAGAIQAVRSTCRVAVTSGTYTYDVNKNGTTIYTTQANRPTRVSGDGLGSKTHTMPDVTSVAAGDVFDVDVDGVGAGISEFTLFIEYIG
jgi:hypothetical protein